MKAKKLFTIFILATILFIFVGCKEKTTISEKKYSEAMDFSANDYFQMKIKDNYKNSYDGNYPYDFTIKVDSDKMVISRNNGDGSYSYYLSFNDGRISLCHNNMYFEDLYLEENDAEDEFADYLGDLDSYDIYTLREIVQVIFWELFGEPEYTFLNPTDLQSFLRKMGENTSKSKDELNEVYQKSLDASIFLKEYNKLDYDEGQKAYLYSDKNCDIKYHFEKSKISKIEYDSADKNSHIEVQISYQKEKLSLPTMYRYANNGSSRVDSFSSNYSVSLGERRDLSVDLSIYNLDLSKGAFRLSDPDFASINEKTYTLTINDFTKSSSAILAFIIDNDVYFIRYILSK